MAKKDLSTGDWRPDDDLDFNFDSEIGTGMAQESKKSRSAVASVAYGVADGVKDKALDPSFYQRILRATLPKHYGEIADATTEVAGGLSELYDQTRQEVKPRLNRISRSLDKFIPDESKGLKKIMGKIVDLTGGQEVEMAQGDGSAQEDQNVALMMGEIFKAQQVDGKIKESRQIMRDAIANKQYKGLSDISLRMQKDISILQQYTTNVTQAYQKKSLELQLRTYLGQRAYYTKSLEMMDIFRKQNDAIVKNTSIPDSVKLTELERLKNIGKDKFMSSLYGDGSVWKKGMNRLKSSAQQGLQGITMRMDMAEMGIDMAAMGADQMKQMNEMMEEMGLPPMTKSQFAGAMAAGWAIDEATNWASPKLKAFIAKHPEFTEKLSWAARFAVNPSGKISKLRKSDDWNRKMSGDGLESKMFKFFDFILENFQENDQTASYGGGNTNDELAEGKGFDKKAYLSLTTVIPGYLSMIHQEVSSLRAGETKPAMRFDFQSGRFKNEKLIALQAKKKMTEAALRSGYGFRVEEAANTLAGDRQGTTDEEKSSLKKFLSKLSRVSNIEYDLDSVQETDAYKDLSPGDQQTVDAFFRHMDAAADKEQRKTEFEISMKKVREATPTYQDTISEIAKSGNADLLARHGLLRRTRDGYDDDPDTLHRFTEEMTGTTKSDMNAKDNIKATTPSELLKTLGEKAYTGMKNTKLYNWMYKKGKGDSQPHSGPMAQDVQANLGDAAAPGGKKIDLQTMNGAFFSAIHYLGEKVEGLAKGRVKGKASESDPLINIDKNVAHIAALMSSGGGGGGFGGGGGGYREGFDLNYFLDKGVSGVKAVGKGVSDAAGTVSNKIAELWGNNKDKLKEKAVWLFNKGSDLAGTIFDASKNFITNTLPDWVGKVKDFGKKVIKGIGEQFETYKDLYLPNGTEPVIRAAKLKAGEYYDQATGLAITSVEQLAEVKGNIVDKAGNIIVDTKELAVGLYDVYGEKARTTIGKVAAFGASAAKYVGGKLLQAAGTLKDMVTGGAGKIKEWWDNSPDFKFPDFGISFYDKKNLAELINIRDILLGDIRAVRKRVRKGKALDASSGGKGGSSEGGGIVDSVKAQAADLQAKYMGEGSVLGKIFGKGGKLSGLGSKAAAMATVATRGNDFMGPMSREEMEAQAILDGKKGQVKGRLASMKEYAQGLLRRGAPQEAFIGPMQPAPDPGDFMGPMPNKSQSRKLAAKDLWGKAKGAGGRMVSGAKGKFGMLADMASGFLSGDGSQAEPSPGAGVDGADGKTDQQQEAEARAANEPKKRRSRRGKVAAKDRAAGDNDGDGVKDGSVEDRQNKLEELKESRDKGTLAADTSTKYKSPENILDTIAKKASGLLESLKGGLGTVFNVASMMFSGGSAVAKGAFGAVKGLASGAAALNAATGGSAAGAGAVMRGLWTGAKLYGAAAAVTTSGALAGMAGFASMALTATAAVAGTVLSALVSPVVLIPAAIAAASYGLYKLYQYVNRNDASPMERLRLRQYGFGHNTAADRYNHYVYMLEEYFQDGRITYQDSGSPRIIDKKVEVKELLALFDIDEKDKEGAANFTTWLRDRFKPVFYAHLAALFKADKKKKLHQVNDLEPEQKLTYLENAKFTNGPYNQDISPFGEKLELDINDEEIMKSYDNLILTVAAEAKKGAKKHKGIEKPDPLKSLPMPGKASDGDQKIDAAKAAAANQAANKGTIGDNALGEGDGSGGKVSGSSDKGSKGGSAPGSINMASGSQLDGANGMQFIKLGKGSRLDGLSPAMLKQFLGMAEEYGRISGKSIPVNSGYRSFEQQKALYARDPSKAAKPGRSLHEYGLAIDINSETANELDRLGLMKKYGFTRPVGGEPWHVEPAGIQRSIDLAKKDPSEREKMVEMSAGRGGGGYGTYAHGTLGKRNHEMAMQILGSPSKLVENKSDESKEAFAKANDAAMAKSEEPKPAVTANTVKQAANDPSAGKSRDLPPTTVGQANTAANQGAVSPDAESEKTAGGGSSGIGTSGSSDVVAALEAAAQKTGVSADLLKAFAAVESGMDPNAKAGNSSAQGLMQFMPDTWREVVSKYGSKHGLPANASPFNPVHASLMGAEYIKNNTKVLNGVRPNPNVVDLYLIHLLGPTGAKRFFQADPSQRCDMVMGEQAAANPGLFYANGKSLTIAEAYERIKQRIQQKSSSFGIKANTSGPGLKAPTSAGGTGSEPGLKLPSAGGVEPNLSGPEVPKTETASAAPKRGFSFDNTSAGYVSQNNQSGQRNDSPSNKLESLMEKSNDTAQESLKALQNIVTSLSEERLAKVLAAVMAAVPQQESKEDSVKEKDKQNMGRTSTANGSSLDLKRRTSA